MSNSLAIATVTATLRNLLTRGLDVSIAGSTVTTQPPGTARDNNSGNQINLFLYHTAIDAALRNWDMPRQVKPGETGKPPLALNLYYLITAYGLDDDDIMSHQLLGQAMSILHDHPLLGAPELKDALPDNDLHEQMERVRITPQPLSVDEMYKLWTTFQTQYRISAAYEVSVVLIESTLPVKTPLPVLKRGADDTGAISQPDLTPPTPTLVSVSLAQDKEKQPSAELGDDLIISGYRLYDAATSVVLQFTNPYRTDSFPVSPEVGEAGTEIIKFKLPDPADDPIASTTWSAGFYTVAAVITKGDTFRTTNELTFSLAPKIANPRPISVARDVNGDATITLTCSPQVRSEQRVSLLLGDREIRREPNETQTDTLTFILKEASPGEYRVRLRVDGVDSLLVDYQAKPPSFKDTETVTIT